MPTQVLYLGLSRNIRGVAEALHTNYGGLHFIKPGEMASRVIIAKQVLAAKSVDAIVAAEAFIGGEKLDSDIPQFQFIIEQLRAQGIKQPIVGLTDRFTEKAMSGFFGVGGDVLLPLRSMTPRFFTINSRLLCGQIGRLIDVAGRNKTSSQTTSFEEELVPGSLAFHGFVLAPNGDATFGGRKLLLSPRAKKVLEIFLKAQTSTVSMQDIREQLYADSIVPSDSTLRAAIFELQNSIKVSLKNECEFDFSIIEAVFKKGWRFNIKNLRQLKGLVNPESLWKEEGVSPEIEIQHYRNNFESLGFVDFSFDRANKAILFRDRPLQLTPTYLKVLIPLLRAKGGVVSRQALHAACFPPHSGASKEVIARYVNYASKRLQAELQRLGFEIPSPLIETIGKKGWAASSEAFGLLERMQPIGHKHNQALQFEPLIA